MNEYVFTVCINSPHGTEIPSGRKQVLIRKNSSHSPYPSRGATSVLPDISTDHFLRRNFRLKVSPAGASKSSSFNKVARLAKLSF